MTLRDKMGKKKVHAGSVIYKSFSMSSAIDLGSVVEAKRLTTLPSRLTKNFYYKEGQSMTPYALNPGNSYLKVPLDALQTGDKRCLVHVDPQIKNTQYTYPRIPG